MISSASIVRYCSIATLGLMPIFILAGNRSPQLFRICATSLFCGCSILTFAPRSYADRTLSKWFSIISTAILLTAALVLPRTGGQESVAELRLLLIAGPAIILYSAVRRIFAETDVNSYFSKEHILGGIEERTRDWMNMLLLFMGTLSLISPFISAPLLLACYILLYFAAYSGQIPLVFEKEKEKVKTAIDRTPKMMPENIIEGDEKMEKLFRKIEAYMNSRKPFLRSDFTISEMSRDVFSNKTYVSKTINYYSGRNFRQFVNYYRVQYSVELIRKDPRLSVPELASMSGFHTPVTFNMAFRLYRKDTPGSFRRESIDTSRDKDDGWD